MGWTVNQMRAFVFQKPKGRHAWDQIVAVDPGAMLRFQQARAKWAAEHDPWGNEPLTVDDWLDGKFKG